MRARPGIALFAAAAALVIGTAGAAHAEPRPGPAAAPPVAATQACGLDAKLVPTCPGQALFGAWVKGYDTGSFTGQITAAEARYKRPIDVVHTYHAPDKPSPIPFGHDNHGDAERKFAMQGSRVVLANFKPGLDFSAAANGAYDDVITQAAKNIKSVAPHKVMLALFHEPENDIHHGGTCTAFKGTVPGNTPDGYRAMWRHTRDVFNAQGVTNVVWVMNYMAFENWDCMINDLWPGNDLVDWIAYDPYSADGSVTTVTRFPNVLKQKTDKNHQYTAKPYLLAEYGVRSCDPAETHAYYDNLRSLVDARTVPNLRGLVVFDSAGADKDAVDYRVGYDCARRPDPAEQASFNRLAADPNLFPVIAN